jgi:hypothetical protein
MLSKDVSEDVMQRFDQKIWSRDFFEDFYIKR